MQTISVMRHLDAAGIAAVTRLLTAAEHVDGRWPLSDPLSLDLAAGGGPGFAAVLASASSDGANGETEALVGYAQLSRGNDTAILELVVDPAHRDRMSEIGTMLIDAAFDVVASDGGGRVTWWVFAADDVHTTLADGAHMHVDRTLFKMRRPLPASAVVAVDTRDFVPGADDDEWLSVNNRAFAGHGEQGGWTLDTLRQRQAAAWFDPAGFRIHERDGRIAAFCWTKVHSGTGPAGEDEGEIYVIAVDPDFHGLGLGRQLTLAGLDHLAGRGLTTAILYVDAANAAAVGLYERLEFQVVAINTAFVTDIAPAGSAPPGPPS